MHKQKKLSINILLLTLLVLASTWAVAILGATKKRTSADATRWSEFLYATTTSVGANNYSYNEDKGWIYNYGKWEDVTGSPNTFAFDPSSTRDHLETSVSDNDNYAQNIYATGGTVILDNYIKNLKVKNVNGSSTITGTKDDYLINNFYLAFNTPVETDNDVIKTDDNGKAKFVSSLSVSAYLNNNEVSLLPSGANTDPNYGVRIDINGTRSEEFKLEEDSANYNSNFYWFEYFDLTDINYLYGNNQTNPLKNAYGLYTIVFNYTVVDYNSTDGGQTSTTETYTYQFYLTDDEKYVEYPILSSTSGESYANDKYSTIYFDMSSYNLPTYLFDASKFEVTYSYEATDNTKTTNTTTFKLFDKDGERLGLLTLGETSYVIKLNEANRQVEYYVGNESVELSDTNKYGVLTIDADGKYYLVLKGNKKYEVANDNKGMLIKTGAKNTPLSYYFPIVMNELGDYTFENKYLIEKDGYNFATIEPYTFTYTDGSGASITKTIGTPKDVFKNYTISDGSKTYTHQEISQLMTYANGVLEFSDASHLNSLNSITSGDDYNASKDGGYNLVFFGIKSIFMKNKVETPFYDETNGVYADVTGTDIDTNGIMDTIRAKNLTALTATSDSVTLNNFANLIPVTNLNPIIFDVYGMLDSSSSNTNKIYFWKNNLSKKNTKDGYYIDDNNNIVVKGAPTESAFTNGVSCENNGLYLIETTTNYSMGGKSSTQYFMFVIDNSDPKMYFYTDTSNSDGTKLSTTTKYTNAETLYLSWEEPNYFQEEITAYVSFSASYGEVADGSKVVYTKDTLLSTVSGATKTPEGLYQIYLYYGPKTSLNNDSDRYHKDPVIYVDRTTPTAKLYAETSVMQTDGSTTTEFKDSNYKLINGQFKLYSDPTKASGAQVTASIAEISFGTSIDDAKLLQIDGKQIITTSSTFSNFTDEQVLFQIYLLNSDYDQNLVLGSNLKSAVSKLYILKLEDDAGNTNEYYYIFDNSSPRAIYQQQDGGEWSQINLTNTSISKDTRILWGDEKGVKLTADTGAMSDDTYFGRFSTYLNDHSTEYKGFGVKTVDGELYYTLALGNVEATAKDNKYTSSTAQYITIVTKESKTSLNDATKWTASDKTEATFAKFVSTKKQTYKVSVSDCLGNKSTSYELYLDTDLSQLAIFPNKIVEDDDEKIKYNESRSSTSLNVDKIQISFTEDIAEDVEAVVTYSYYPFAITSYLSNDKVEDGDKKSNFFNNTSFGNVNGNSDSFTITYPFSQVASITDRAVSSGADLNTYTDGEKTLSQEGLYVLKRVYKHKSTGVQFTDDELKDLNDDDFPEIHMYIVVDRKGVMSLKFNSAGEVLTAESIGDLISITLGDGTNKTITVDAKTLSKSESFSTNRVKVTTSVPFDKYSSASKLKSENALFEANDDAINTAIEQNNELFKLYITFYKTITDSNNSISSDVYLITNNQLTDAGKALIQGTQSFDEVDTVKHLLSLVKAGKYKLVISDKAQNEVVDNNNNTTYEPDKYETSHTIEFEITNKEPLGNYASCYDDANHTVYELSIQSDKSYKSVNKDALLFEFEDSENQYDAKIDAGHILVERSSDGNQFTTIFAMNNGDVVTHPSWDAEALGELSVEEYVGKYILQKEEINDAIDDDDKLYKYTLNIFNNYINKPLLSERDADYYYRVTIYYEGEESFYIGDDNKPFYSSTYTIHQDIVAPSQNLATLTEKAKEYATDVDPETYFFAVGKDATYLGCSQPDESNELYIRKLESVKDSPSLLPGDENYGSLNTNAPSFNPLSIDEQYKSVGLGTYAYYSFENIANGYYEAIEMDVAQNITRYFIYVSDQTETWVNVIYKEKFSDDDSKNLVDYNNTITYQNNQEISLAELINIENFFVKNNYVNKRGDEPTTSKNDSYTVTDYDDALYFDKFISVYIKDESGNTIHTVTSDAYNETLAEFYKRVVKEFEEKTQASTAHTFYLEFLNRFGENYSIKLLMPGPELQLKFTNNASGEYFEVEVPGSSENVYLVSFTPKTLSGNSSIGVYTDKNGTHITTESTIGLTNATYQFGSGCYIFEVEDNYGRKQSIPYYYGEGTDANKEFGYGKNTVEINDDDLGDITHTNQEVTLKLNNTLWKVEIFYGENLEKLKTNFAEDTTAGTTTYNISKYKDGKGKNTYTFSTEGYYYIRLTWGMYELSNSTEKESETEIFCINKTLPKAFAVFEGGLTNELINGTSYSENISLIWESDYDVTGTVVYSSNNSSTTYSISADDLYFEVVQDGSYSITLIDAIGNTQTWMFEKTASSNRYYSVVSGGQILRPSSHFGNKDGKKIAYYYVSYEYDEESEIYTLPTVDVTPDASKGVLREAVQEVTVDNIGDTKYSEYKIYTKKGEGNEYVICYVRVVYVQKSNDFAGAELIETLDNSGITPTLQPNLIENSVNKSYAKQLTLSFNSINKPDEAEDDEFNGNVIYVEHYLNGQYLNTITGDVGKEKTEIVITASGYHEFRIYDTCGNVQMFDDYYYGIYVINSVIYSINGSTPIDNCFYNDEVKVGVTSKIGSETLYDYTITATLNGTKLSDSDLTPSQDDLYIFTTPGYYTISLTATVDENTAITLEKTFSFTIINQNVAMIAFNIPTSYGFSIESIYKNEANMTDTLENKSTLWLSAGGEFGSGVFTINATYYDKSLGQILPFSFKVWINEETPTILPINYTYGTKKSSPISIQYNCSVIYSQIGCGYILVTNSKGTVVNRIEITAESENVVSQLTFNASGTYTVGLYNDEGKIISSYKVIKTTPLNSSAKLIIIIVSCVAIALGVVFVFLRKKMKFR